MAESLRYIRNHWAALTLYAKDGRILIDNNRVEQLMREVTHVSVGALKGATSERF